MMDIWLEAHSFAVYRPDRHLKRVNHPDPITSLNAALEGRYHIERQLGEGRIPWTEPQLLSPISPPQNPPRLRVDAVRLFPTTGGDPCACRI